MYKIKQVPEDFVVKEHLKLPTSDSGDGQYSYWHMKKRDFTTMMALDKIAYFLKIPLKNISFAGTKDRHAVTYQYISIKGAQKGRVEKFEHDNISLSFEGCGDKPLSMGSLDENHFDITIRAIDKMPNPITQVINYFDEQRFSKNNHLVGLAILKKDFKGACELLEERQVIRHLERYPNDYVGAIKTIPFKIRLMYVHAFQSYVYNKTITQYLQCKYKCETMDYSLGSLAKPLEPVKSVNIPLIGFGTETDNSEVDKISSAILAEEGVTQRDFVIRAMPELSSEGTLRNMMAEVTGLEIGELQDDELNAGMKKVTVSFSLPKGSYATMAVRMMMI